MERDEKSKTRKKGEEKKKEGREERDPLDSLYQILSVHPPSPKRHDVIINNCAKSVVE